MDKYKVLLIHPEKLEQKKVLDKLLYPPMGIAILASTLRNEGIEPLIYDANIEKGDHFNNLFDIINQEKINIIGLSFTSILAKGAYYFADKIKKEFPSIPIIAGGYHPTVMPVEVINYPAIDYVVVGEGEITFPLFLKALQGNEELKNVKGLYLRENNESIFTGKRTLIPDMDDIPFPAYDLLKINNYSSLSSTKKPFVTFIRSRGCPFKCVFCGVDAMFSRKYRCQSPERTMKDILKLVKEYKVKEILFKDSDFLINKNNTEELCRLLIKEKLNLIWSCNARVDMVDGKILKLMKEAGCKQISFGIESGSQKMLDELCKDFKVEEITRAVKLTKEEGIQCVGDFIIGAPGEDNSTINETLELIKTLNLDYVSIHFLTAFPGSPLYDKVVENNLLIDEQLGYEGININLTKLSNEELKRAVNLLIRSFYFRPSYILKRLKKLNLYEIKSNFVGLFSLVKKMIK